MSRGKARHCYAYPRPMVTVDVLLLTLMEGRLAALFIRRARDPHAGRLALPGGFVDRDEDLADAARREVQEETGLKLKTLHQIGAFGTPGRDPRGHTISIAFYAACSPHAARRGLVAGDDASEAAFRILGEEGPLAFDHAEVLCAGLDRLRTDAQRSGIIGDLLPQRFTAEEHRAAARALGLPRPGAALKRALNAGQLRAAPARSDGTPRFRRSSAR